MNPTDDDARPPQGAAAPSPATREAHEDLLRGARGFIAVADSKSAAVATVSTALLALLLLDKQPFDDGVEGWVELGVYVIYWIAICLTLSSCLATFWAGHLEAWRERVIGSSSASVTRWEDVPPTYDTFARRRAAVTLEELHEEERRRAFADARIARAKMIWVQRNITLFLVTLGVLAVLIFLRRTT